MNHSLLLVLLQLGVGDNDLNNAETVAVEAEFIKVLKDLFKNEVLHVFREAATLKHLSDHVSSLIIL